MATNEIKQNIAAVYKRRKNALIARSYQYAGFALQRFRQKQPTGPGIKGAFWTNQTSIAADKVFSGVISEKGVVGFFLAHNVEYGVSLELANDRRHESLRPTVMAFYSRFDRDVKKDYE